MFQQNKTDFSCIKELAELFDPVIAEVRANTEWMRAFNEALQGKRPCP
ncbi:hypothetical protein [Paraburkholderia bryophila]|uniref:Uncharacterized protein n=1 Tax=Paraburkholderia bryophila TaxID=420952 RepID=A0A7Z0B7Z8_9BURK|nr:hypothetical protein [Paraburkholderia bryophila]NYH24664.1 hypothetical protein [Paraburkholderia bryophila]